ncbi:MAG: sulfotransferase domain-containing protein [Marinicellaceae bacterium]
MYWIASYPRSGNTFLRILFKEVYGIYTWEGYGKETPENVLSGRLKKHQESPILIKTHELPTHTQIPHEKLKSIYLVRDGRDAAISMAYHRCNIVKPGSDLMFNLRTAILAPFGTSFGGWSKHVKQWSKHADLIIRFEDLIANPVQELKKIEKIIDLPKADFSKIPSFTDLKNNKYSLGSGNDKLTEHQQKKRRQKFFRSGKVNEWKTKISQPLINVFNFKHGSVLKEMGYSETNHGPLVYFQFIGQYAHWIKGYILEKYREKKR